MTLHHVLHDVALKVPVYAITSWLAMVFSASPLTPWLGAFRDCYEAYCIYIFMALMIAILGGCNQASKQASKRASKQASKRGGGGGGR